MKTLHHLGVPLEISDQEAEALDRLRAAVRAAGFPRKTAVPVPADDLCAWEDIAQRYERLGVPCAFANEHGLLFKGVALVEAR